MLARDPVSKPYMQFKTFVTQEIEFLLGQKIPLTRAQQIKAWGIFGLLGGAMGMPFVTDINNFTNLFFEVDIEQWMANNAPDVVNYGVPALIGQGYSIRQMAGFPEVADSFGMTNFPGGVLQGKARSAWYNYKTGRRSGLEAFVRSSTIADRIWQTAELTEHGRTFRGDWSIKGGFWTGVGQISGIRTIENERNHLKIRGERLEADRKRKETNRKKRENRGGGGKAPAL